MCYRYSLVSVAEREELPVKVSKASSDQDDRSPLLVPASSSSD